MSLKELLELNKMVFGVSSPKIRAFYNDNGASYVASSNFDNVFVYTGHYYNIVDCKFYYNGTSLRQDFYFNSYANLGDFVRKFENSMHVVVTRVDIVVRCSFINAAVSCPAVDIQLGQESGKISKFYYQTSTVYETRFYLLEYDQTKIMKF